MSPSRNAKDGTTPSASSPRLVRKKLVFPWRCILSSFSSKTLVIVMYSRAFLYTEALSPGIQSPSATSSSVNARTRWKGNWRRFSDGSEISGFATGANLRSSISLKSGESPGLVLGSGTCNPFFFVLRDNLCFLRLSQCFHRSVYT